MQRNPDGIWSQSWCEILPNDRPAKKQACKITGLRKCRPAKWQACAGPILWAMPDHIAGRLLIVSNHEFDSYSKPRAVSNKIQIWTSSKIRMWFGHSARKCEICPKWQAFENPALRNDRPVQACQFAGRHPTVPTAIRYLSNWWYLRRMDQNWLQLMRIDENWWELMRIDENWWKLMKIDENWWELMKIHENSWKFMRIDENWWELMKIGENWWELMRIDDQVAPNGSNPINWSNFHTGQW